MYHIYHCSVLLLYGNEPWCIYVVNIDVHNQKTCQSSVISQTTIFLIVLFSFPGFYMSLNFIFNQRSSLQKCACAPTHTSVCQLVTPEFMCPATLKCDFFFLWHSLYSVFSVYSNYDNNTPRKSHQF